MTSTLLEHLHQPSIVEDIGINDNMVTRRDRQAREQDPPGGRTRVVRQMPDRHVGAVPTEAPGGGRAEGGSACEV